MRGIALLDRDYITQDVLISRSPIDIPLNRHSNIISINGCSATTVPHSQRNPNIHPSTNNQHNRILPSHNFVYSPKFLLELAYDILRRE